MADKTVKSTYTTAAFRLSYPALFEPVAVMGDATKMKYSVTMLFPKKSISEALKAQKHPATTWLPTDNCAGLYQEIVKIARANFGPEVDLKTLKLPKFRDGDKPKERTGQVDDNEKGYIVLHSTSNTRPDVLRGDKTRITAAEASEVYPGCWVRAVLTVSPFVHKVGGRGVTIYLGGIQKLADDTTFSSRPRSEDAFDAVASGEGASAAPTAIPAGDKDPWEA